MKKVIIIITVTSLCFLTVLLNTTTPASAGPIGILAIFIFVYLSSLGVVTYLLFGVSRLIAYFSKIFMFRRPFAMWSFKKSYYYSTIISAMPTMLIGLQSVGPISIYEILLVSFFVIIGCLYISKRVH